MSEQSYYQVTVPPDVAELVPAFLVNRHKDLAEIRSCLTTGNFQSIAATAERMIGAGAPYGFPHITNVGRAILDSARRCDDKLLSLLLTDLESYLSIVKWKAL